MSIIDILHKFVNDSSNEEVIAECKKALDVFIKDNASTMSFSFIKIEDYNKFISNFCVAISSEHVLSVELLTFMRLLSREKSLVTSMVEVSELLDLFIAVFEKECEMNSIEYVRKVEILKCLCNWVYHSKVVRDYVIEKRMMDSIVNKIRTTEIDDNVFYQIRLIFLISALEPSERSKMLENGALMSLICVMEEALKRTEGSKLSYDAERTLTEVLKALFNITFELTSVTSEHIHNDCKKLATHARSMLCTLYPFDHENANDIFTHIANYLLNLPKDAIALLVPPIGQDDVDVPLLKSKHPKVFQEHDMTVAVILLDALEQRIAFTDNTLMKEKTLTILTTFSYICRINRVMRKYLKEEILPRLKTSNVRPEDQKGLRGQIIRLLQDVDIPLKNMAADFLFVLCKENTTRLIKYAGYGNSAGFLASRGLMIPGIPYAIDGDYSPDEDSGADEDEELDVITGATALPKEDVFANLTEEEKEREIDNLISMTNRLKELNVVKPMAVKRDGKLVEVDKLQPMSDGDSDSD